MSKYKISYSYQKINNQDKLGCKTGREIIVEAETEQGAIEIVKSKHYGCDVEIKKIKRI